jgi:hypothetical protein
MYIFINKVTRSGATTNVFILIVFGCIVFFMQGHTWTLRGMYWPAGNTGESKGINWNTLKSVIGDYRIRKDVFIRGNV